MLFLHTCTHPIAESQQAIDIHVCSLLLEPHIKVTNTAPNPLLLSSLHTHKGWTLKTTFNLVRVTPAPTGPIIITVCPSDRDGNVQKVLLSAPA